LAGAASPEVHIYDAEVPPETEIRHQVARIVNLRPGCRTFVMKRRTLEHYLESQAIFEACGVWVEVPDQEDVAEAVARERHRQYSQQIAWEHIPARSRKRRRDKIKRRLNTVAAESMTAERLAQADPDGEIRRWLAAIAELADGPS
jgi:cell division FtsZ-interacting protein ZapD